ncbi:hypothetical protein BpHYR1_041922 [Brachionus plicatilis]|uniref:Uncharacterized protein n=1 Tax=Brachionus plicatilis TaxID=10195 RepID=A0A3M7SJF2_BRAPC|nr:hypothetical protein BpHYR1_041922 [Brachionus plicatilis]
MMQMFEFLSIAKAFSKASVPNPLSRPIRIARIFIETINFSHQDFLQMISLIRLHNLYGLISILEFGFSYSDEYKNFKKYLEAFKIFDKDNLTVMRTSLCMYSVRFAVACTRLNQ